MDPALAGNPYEVVGTDPLLGWPVRRWQAERDLAIIDRWLAEPEAAWAHAALRRQRDRLRAMVGGEGA